MGTFARILVVFLLAAFAAGTVAHAASAATMSLKMTMTDPGDGKNGDCPSCSLDNEGETPLCDQVCLAPFVATPIAGVPAPLVIAPDLSVLPLIDAAGQSGRPDPHPPRISILH